jgi:hypothetical protein
VTLAPKVAVRVAAVGLVTTPADAVNGAEDAPCGTLTTAGTTTAEFDELRETVAPLAGAGFERLIVQED